MRNLLLVEEGGTKWNNDCDDNHDGNEQDEVEDLVALLLVEEGGREREPVGASRAHQLSTLGGKGGISSNLAMMIVFFLHDT